MVATVAAFVSTSALGAGTCPTKIRIGVEGAYPPFSEETSSGDLVGFDIDIAKALCATLGAECPLVKQDWDGIIPALLARKYDAIIASMSITEERRKKVDFTNKYYNTPARFVLAKGSAMEFTEAGMAGKRVGVQRGTTHDNYITDNFSDAEIVRYDTQDQVYLDLQAGRIDVALQDSVAANDGFLSKPEGAGFMFTGPELTDVRWFGEGAGIAVRKKDVDLRNCLNAAIRSIRSNGTYKKINDSYFAFDIFGGD